MDNLSPDIVRSDQQFDRAAWGLGGGDTAALKSAGRGRPSRRIQDQFCPFCGGRIPRDFILCVHCGRDV